MFFVTANKGMIEVFNGFDNMIARVKDAKTLAYVMYVYDIENVLFSSNMDFAHEYGFENHDDAKKIWQEAEKMT